MQRTVPAANRAIPAEDSARDATAADPPAQKGSLSGSDEAARRQAVERDLLFSRLQRELPVRFKRDAHRDLA